MISDGRFLSFRSTDKEVFFFTDDFSYFYYDFTYDTGLFILLNSFLIKLLSIKPRTLNKIFRFGKLFDERILSLKKNYTMSNL